MKAVILAAGKGERLKEITKNVPKPMILYNDKPVLQYNIELCKKFGVTNIFINTHHHAEQIKNYFGDGQKFGVNINYSQEKELLGTSGAVKKIAEDYWIKNNFTLHTNKIGEGVEVLLDNSILEPFFVLYGDQFSNYDLSLLIKKYKMFDTIGVIAFHYRKDVVHSGVAEFYDKNKICKFIEKPEPGQTVSHWVNAGIYFLSPKIIDFIPEGFSDFGKQIFPNLIKSNFALYGTCVKKEVKVFDTIELYQKSFSKSK